MYCAFRQHRGYVQVDVSKIVLWDFPLLKKDSVALTLRKDDENKNKIEHGKYLDAHL